MTLRFCGPVPSETDGREEDSARCLATWDASFDPAGRSVPSVVNDLLHLQPNNQTWNLAYIDVSTKPTKTNKEAHNEPLLSRMPTAVDGLVDHGAHMWREDVYDNCISKKVVAKRVYFRLK